MELIILVQIAYIAHAFNVTDPNGCDYYKAEDVVATDNTVWNDINIIDKTMEIQFDIKLNDYCESPSFCNILRIGSGELLYPALDIMNMSKNNEIGLHINPTPTYKISNSHLIPDNKYHNIYLYISPHFHVFRVDYHLYQYHFQWNMTRNEERLTDNVSYPLYLSNPTHDSMPNASVSNICVTSPPHKVSNGKMECGDIIYGELTSSSEINYYHFELFQPQIVSFNTCLSSYNTHLYLYDMDFSIIYEGDVQCEYPETSVISLSVGEYILGISGYGSLSNHEYGTWQVQMRCNDEIKCGDKKTGELTSRSDIDYYFFNLSTTKTVIFDSCGSSYDTHLYLYDVNKNQILHESEDEGSCEDQAQLFISLLSPGYYMLGIGGYGDHSDHDYGRWQLGVDCYDDFADYNLSYIMITDGSVNSWLDGESECERLFGTSLATISTNEDLLEAKKIVVAQLGVANLYIGLHKDGVAPGLNKMDTVPPKSCQWVDIN